MTEEKLMSELKLLTNMRRSETKLFIQPSVYLKQQKFVSVDTLYLGYNVSVLGVDLSDGSQITDHTEHLVHLQQQNHADVTTEKT